MNGDQLEVSRVHEIISVERLAVSSDDVAAFAIDSPKPGDRPPGSGIEINGWVIGQQRRDFSVLSRSANSPARSAPLDVLRPDVAADYPAFADAAASGFSFWAPLRPISRDWRLIVEAKFENGQAVALAAITGRIIDVVPDIPAGYRSVSGPDFVIIGAQRGGTTSLHAYLGAHPQISNAVTKEIHFLTDRHERGRDWYLGQFPTPLPIDVLTGEATPYALFHPQAPGRVREAAPNAKLIALLRNPVERAYSHYLHERSHGFENLDFAAALDAEVTRLAGEDDLLARNPAYISFAHKHASYLARGHYSRQISRWFSHFPRDRFLILRSEDLYERTEATFARVTTFLGVPAADVSFSVHNRTSGPRLDPNIRDRLARHFAPMNDDLGELLGWDPGWT